MGSLVEKYQKCGKNCQCKSANSKGHGPYLLYQWYDPNYINPKTGKHQKNRQKYLGKTLEKALARLRALNLEKDELIKHELDMVRILPPAHDMVRPKVPVEVEV